mmetsp:Transcript_23696/g.28928  ORF Transcript_23696/g.28928 Transcript_23696/m.28928 type:complete len:214 (+) Transcript_23696:1081-1722(+)
MLERIIEGREMTLVLEALTNVPSSTMYGTKIRRLLEELRTEGDSKRQMTYQQSSSISPTSLNNLAEGTKKAVEAIEMLSRNDPPGMRQQVTFLLDSWIRVHNEAPGSEKALAQYLQLLQQHGVGKADDITERFFRISTELVVEACLKTLDDKTKMLNYTVIDAYDFKHFWECFSCYLCNTFLYEGFSFAWLELISHRMFLSNILLLKNHITKL